VRQGDLVVVHLVNHLSVSTSIHWHGVAVPNAEDGVPGITQNAVQPGQTYTYRFIAKDPGTYWYHSHQDGLTQVGQGLFGALVVAPSAPTTRDDVDTTVTLHEWVHTLALNNSAGTLQIPAKPGDRVRLRLINTDNNVHMVTVIGAPFTVVALDGHDLHGPQPLDDRTLLPIGAGQRYDVRFRMPANGAVSLRLANDQAFNDHRGQGGGQFFPQGQFGGAEPLLAGPAVLVGTSAQPEPSSAAGQQWFDLATYGTPGASDTTPNSHFDATYTLTLNEQFSFAGGKPNVQFTFNGKTFPDTSPIVVREGEVVRLHFVNNGRAIHPIHLHGHTFVVLEQNGKPLTGSPVRLDTVLVMPHESYDVAFVANNPGIWMLHCHNMYHAMNGMDLLVVYQNVTTPYHTGGPTNNIPM
jgi:FtsP/CotA-like multicopper oxidase with cupredoxin domain